MSPWIENSDDTICDHRMLAGPGIFVDGNRQTFSSGGYHPSGLVRARGLKTLTDHRKTSTS